MVRTRRQAARQPEPATNPQPTESGSESDSDIPATGSRSKADPHRLGTLRPSREGRPKVFLEPKKRRAPAAQVGNQSPSEAKKRRREPAIPSSAHKRRKTVPAEAVNPVAMELMNDFNKKARGTTRGVQVPRMRRITVEIVQSSARNSVPRAAPEAGTEQEGRARAEEGRSDREGEQPGEDLEEEVGKESRPIHTDHESPAMKDAHREVGSPELDVASQTTAKPEVEQSHTQPVQEPMEGSKRGAGDVPPRSGQGNAPQVDSPQEPPSQRTTRKAKPGVPKPVFNERPMVEAAVRSVSKSTSAAPRTSEQPHVTSMEPLLEKEHLEELFQHDEASPRRTSTQESIFISEDSSEEEEAIDGLEERLSSNGAQDPVSHPTPSTTEVQMTVRVLSKEVRSMCYLMGLKGWTTLGRSWASQLSQRTTLGAEGLPTTPFGKKIRQLVVVMRKVYRRAPQVRNAARQKSFLEQKAEKTEKAIAEITHHVDKTCNKYYTAVQRGEDGHLVSPKDVLKEDIIQCVIPLFMLLLRDFFFLGSSSVGADGDRVLPEKGGDFTATSLQLLKRTASWITRLAAIIKRETELSMLEPTSDEEDRQTKSSTRRKPDILRKKIEERAKQRIALEEHARQFLRTLSKARHEVDEDANKEARRRAGMARAEEEKVEKEQEEREALEKRQKRAEEEKAKREQEEREALEEKQKRWEAMCASTQRLREGIGPLSSMWVKAQQLEENNARRPTTPKRLAAEGQRELVGRERTRSPDLGGFFDDAQVYHPEPQVYHQESRLLLLEDGYSAAVVDPLPTARSWTMVESQWLLGKLKEGGQPDYDSWAEALGRRVDEVRQEVHLLKVSTRSLATDKGKKVPPWARY